MRGSVRFGLGGTDQARIKAKWRKWPAEPPNHPGALPRWAVLACALLSLGGCQTLAEERAQRAAALQRERCQSYGFAPGTNGFATCMMRRDALREEGAVRSVIARERACQEARSNRPSFINGMNIAMAQGGLIAHLHLVRAAYTLANTRDTCTADHSPPRAAGTPRAFNPSANACRDAAPAARNSSMTSAKSCARSSVFAARTAALAAFPCFA